MRSWPKNDNNHILIIYFPFRSSRRTRACLRYKYPKLQLLYYNSIIFNWEKNNRFSSFYLVVFKFDGHQQPIQNRFVFEILGSSIIESHMTGADIHSIRITEFLFSWVLLVDFSVQFVLFDAHTTVLWFDDLN